jgi:hypothetical protein
MLNRIAHEYTDPELAFLAGMIRGMLRKIAVCHTCEW